jgi:hypothetical protein
LLEQITRTTPLRRITLQFSQIRLTLDLTFMTHTPTAPRPFLPDCYAASGAAGAAGGYRRRTIRPRARS